MHRLVRDPWQVGESRQPERVVVVPVGDHDRRQRPIRDGGERRAKGRPCAGAGTGVHQQRALRSDDQSEVDRLRLGHSDVDA